MRRIINNIVFFAAAAMALASCQKNEMPAPEKQELHFTIKAGIETRTSITDKGDGTYTPKWHKEDQIGIFFTEPNEKVEKVDATFSNTKEDGPVASFEGSATVKGEGVFYAFYPKSAFNQHYGDGTIRLDLSAAQKPTSSSFDPECDILVAKPCNYLADGETVVINDLYFARLMSVLKINLKGDYAKGEVVESLTFSVDGVDVTGNAKVDYKTATIKGWNNGGVKRNVTATYLAEEYITIAGENNSAYLVVAPVTIKSGTALTFTLKTKNYNITKTVNAPSDMSFPEGNVAVINLTINEENCELIDTSIDYSGEWLITGVKETQTYAVSAYVDGNNLDVLVPITVADEKITEVDGLAACKMVITKVSTEGYAGMYTIEDASSTEEKRSYLYAAGTGTNNYLKADSKLSPGSYWDITKNDNGTYTIIASKHTSERNTIWYNTSNNIFSCYQSNATSYKPITLYPYSMVVPDTTPRINATDKEFLVEADATTVDIPYTVKNISGNITATVADGATMTIKSTSVKTDKVEVTFDANETSESKTATIVLSYEGAESVSVVLSQAGKPAGGGEVTITTWSWAGGIKNNFINAEGVETTYGLGSDYAESHGAYRVKLDDTGDYFIVKVDGPVQKVSVGVKMIGGTSTSYLDIQGSTDGKSYSSVQKFTISGSSTSTILNLATTASFDASYRYIKFYYTKGSNVGVGPISIEYISGSSSGGETLEPEEPETTVTPVYESLADLIAAGAPTTTASKVTVTLDEEKITRIFVTNNGYRNGVFLIVGDKEIEIYSRDVPADWVVGGTISGTLTECDWKLYNTTWELCPADWSELTYTAPQEPDEPETPLEPTLSPRNLAFSATTATATIGQAFSAPNLSGVTTGVIYSSSNTAVATVDASTGAVTLVGAGTTTITATASETAEYEAGTANYTLTVSAAQDGGDELIPSDTPCYTLDGTITGGNNGYATVSDITQGDLDWSVTGNTTVSPWRVGGKSLSSVDRNVYTKEVYTSRLSKIEFISGTKESGLTWNSLVLEYSTNSDFTGSQVIIASEIGANKTILFAPEGGFPANCYYRFRINVTVTNTSSNKYLQLKAINFYGYQN